MYVGSNATFIMNSGTISGNTFTALTTHNSSDGVFVDSTGIFIMNGGTISDNTVVCSSSSSSSRIYGGGVYVGSNATFIMNSGTISGNTLSTAGYEAGGGGVYVASDGIFTMYDGTISDNNVTASGTESSGYRAAGGGVCNNGIFTMEDGIISGNRVISYNPYYYGSPCGGGVYVEGDYWSRGTFIMNGGIIADNTVISSSDNSPPCGGGVYVGGAHGNFAMCGGIIYGINSDRSNVAGDGAALYVVNGTATHGGTIITRDRYDNTISFGLVTIHYDTSGWTGTPPASQTVSAGSIMTLLDGSDYAQTGYDFGGWNTNASGKGVHYGIGSSYVALCDAILYPIWVSTVTLTTLTEDTWANGNISTSSGEQWFRFSATASTQYIHASYGTLKNLYVQLYDSNYNTVGSTTTMSYYNANHYISLSVTSGQVYNMKIWPYGSGTYQIAFNVSKTAP